LEQDESNVRQLRQPLPVNVALDILVGYEDTLLISMVPGGRHFLMTNVANTAERIGNVQEIRITCCS
jgi:hypothetical protein